MDSEYQKVRERIARIICCLCEGKPNESEDHPGLNSSKECDYCHAHKGCPDEWTDVAEEVDAILSDPSIVIKAADQTLPKTAYKITMNYIDDTEAQRIEKITEIAQIDMQDSGWVKTLPKE